MNSLRFTPVYSALNRPNLIMGGEREPVLSNILVLIALLFASLVGSSFASMVLSIAIFVFVLWALRSLAKADPQMQHIYLKHQKYQRYHSHRSTPFRIDK